MKKVAVLGSFVVDLMSKTPHLPARGETVFGGPFRVGPGGKGSNQGVAAKRAGADVTMITKLGRDEFAEIALNSFRAEDMETEFIYQDDQHETGAALIMVEEGSAENAIVVSIGACNYLTAHEIEAAAKKIKNSQIFLTQLETNLEAVRAGIKVAKSYNVPVILNPAPVQPIADEVFPDIDYLTPNEVEAEILTGIKIRKIADAQKAAVHFLAKGVQNVIITLGKNGALIKNNSIEKHIPAYEIDNVVDTTGAGDAFNGGLATALAEGKSLEDAVCFGNAVGALSVTKIGTAPAMPYRDEIEDFMQAHRQKGEKQ